MISVFVIDMYYHSPSITLYCYEFILKRLGHPPYAGMYVHITPEGTYIYDIIQYDEFIAVSIFVISPQK